MCFRDPRAAGKDLEQGLCLKELVRGGLRSRTGLARAPNVRNGKCYVETFRVLGLN